MRVTDSLRVGNLQRNIAAGLSNLNTVQNQIATGKRVNTVSDDPTGASQALALRATLVDNAQYQTNADAAHSFLSASDGALGSATDALQQARTIAVQGASGTQTPETMQALAAQVSGLIRQLTQDANADIHGKYLFAGTLTQSPPFQAPATGTDPTPVYVGNSGTVSAILGKNNVLPLSTPGNQAFGSAFKALQDLQNNLASGSQAAVSTSIGAVDAQVTAVSSVRANVGAKLNDVTLLKQNLTRAQGEYQASDDNIESVDLAQAYVQLQSAQNVYQASLVTTSKAFQYSLASYL